MALLDFTSTGWSEADPGADLVRFTNKVTVDSLPRTLHTWAIWAVSTPGLGAYEMSQGFELQMKITARLGGGFESWHYPDVVALSSFVGDRAQSDAGNHSYLCVMFGERGSSGNPYFTLAERDGASVQYDGLAEGTYSHGVVYYVTFKLVGQTLTAVIRTGSHTGSIVETLTLTASADMSAATFNQLYSFRGVGTSSSSTWHGDIENFEWVDEPKYADEAAEGGGAGGPFTFSSFNLAGRRRRQSAGGVWI